MAISPFYYNQGWEAYCQGMSQYANPYHGCQSEDTYKFDWWYGGWQDARKAYKI